VKNWGAIWRIMAFNITRGFVVGSRAAAASRPLRAGRSPARRSRERGKSGDTYVRQLEPDSRMDQTAGGASTRISAIRLKPSEAIPKSNYAVFVGCVHICPQPRQLNHWIVPTAAPASRSLLPQLLQHCSGGGRGAGCGAEDFGVSIRRSDCVATVD